MNDPLVSVIVPCYQNHQFLFECLESIINQNYKKLELIITDDGSDNFNKKDIEDYLSKKTNKNIKRIIINYNQKNLGTVKNLNKGLSLSSGEIIMFPAADDVLYDVSVISNYVDFFKKNPQAKIVISQVKMYDFSLKKTIKNFLSKRDIKKIVTLTPNQLFSEISINHIITGCGTCYKKELFLKYNLFDETYKLIEDFPTALKLSRIGIKYYFANFISYKHRDGGISHGNILTEKIKNKTYQEDIIKVYEKELLPYTNLLNNYQDMISDYNYKKAIFEYKYNFPNLKTQDKKKFFHKKTRIIMLGYINEVYKEILNQLSGKKAIILYIGVLIYILNQCLVSQVIFNLISIIMIYTVLILIFRILIQKFLARLLNFVKTKHQVWISK